MCLGCSYLHAVLRREEVREKDEGTKLVFRERHIREIEREKIPGKIEKGGTSGRQSHIQAGRWEAREIHTENSG